MSEIFRGSWLLELEPWRKPAKVFWNTGWAEDKREYLDFPTFASMVPPGWGPLLEDLVVKLLAMGWDGGFHQIKEKFGGLRFYWGNNIPGVIGRCADDVVAQAESQSMATCQDCGMSGELHGDGWLVTLCKECWEKYKEARKGRWNSEGE